MGSTGTKIFISYAREDADKARKLYNDLKQKGLNPWLDREDILPGQNWEKVINREIKDAAYFLALISENSISKEGFVQAELKKAFDRLDRFPSSDIFIIPVRLDDSKPKEERLEDIHWVDLFPDYESGFLRILRVCAPDKTLCPNCKESIEEDWDMCPRCESVLRLLCPQCGRQVRESWRRCPGCKTRLEELNVPEIEVVEREKAETRRTGETFVEPVTGMEFIYVPGGSFMMGDVLDVGYGDEKPVHEVELDGFYMGKYPVTQQQWVKVMGKNPSYFKGDDNPVENVSWNDAQKFIEELIKMNDGKYQFRLPTEAEWEYTARSGGKNEKYAGGDDVEAVAWYYGNSGGKTHPVGQKTPNGLGIYDMSGNVWEWCRDWYGEYSQGKVKNPTGASIGSGRVHRGGGWGLYAEYCRTSHRSDYLPDLRNDNIGFRLHRTV